MIPSNAQDRYGDSQSVFVQKMPNSAGHARVSSVNSWPGETPRRGSIQAAMTIHFNFKRRKERANTARMRTDENRNVGEPMKE